MFGLSKKNTNILRFILIFAVIKSVIHLYTNAFAGYGIFRDELYYLACADHPDIGYVDQPPLSIWILAVVTKIFGKSLFALRLFPAFLSGGAIFFIGLTTFELGGRKISISIVCSALIISLIHLGYSAYYSMNVIDLFLWAVALFYVVRIIKKEDPKYWIYIGFIIGLASINKIGALFFGAGLALGTIILRRRWLTTKWPYIGAAISFLMFLPYIIWNLMHDMAHFEFIQNASSFKYSGMNPTLFWTGQILINNPVTLPVWLLSIVYVIKERKNKQYRFLFVIFLTVASILTINGTSKPEYLAAIFPVLLIGGALMLEQWNKRFKWMFPLIMVILISGVFLIPVSLPILPVEQYISFSETIGIKPESTEGKELGPLPQHYADRFGWEEKAAALAEVYHTLSPEEQQKCAIFGNNYGISGAVDYYAEKYDLPKSIGKHNNYWLWGTRDYTGELVLILDDKEGRNRNSEHFESVEDRGIVTCQYCMPYENNLHIYLCRNLKMPLSEAWPAIKSYN